MKFHKTCHYCNAIGHSDVMFREVIQEVIVSGGGAWGGRPTARAEYHDVYYHKECYAKKYPKANIRKSECGVWIVDEENDHPDYRIGDKKEEYKFKNVNREVI